jgi:hypothetical protein
MIQASEKDANRILFVVAPFDHVQEVARLEDIFFTTIRPRAGGGAVVEVP